MINTIIRAPKGEDRREISIDKIEVPDLWFIGMALIDDGNRTGGEMVLETWHLAHDLITNIQAHNNNIKL